MLIFEIINSSIPTAVQRKAERTLIKKADRKDLTVNGYMCHLILYHHLQQLENNAK